MASIAQTQLPKRKLYDCKLTFYLDGLKKTPLIANLFPKCAAPNCSNDARSLCARCKRVSYCGVECLRIHWKVHKLKCNISRNEPPVSAAAPPPTALASADSNASCGPIHSPLETQTSRLNSSKPQGLVKYLFDELNEALPSSQRNYTGTDSIDVLVRKQDYVSAIQCLRSSSDSIKRLQLLEQLGDEGHAICWFERIRYLYLHGEETGFSDDLITAMVQSWCNGLHLLELEKACISNDHDFAVPNHLSLVYGHFYNYALQKIRYKDTTTQTQISFARKGWILSYKPNAYPQNAQSPLWLIYAQPDELPIDFYPPDQWAERRLVKHQELVVVIEQEMLNHPLLETYTSQEVDQQLQREKHPFVIRWIRSQVPLEKQVKWLKERAKTNVICALELVRSFSIQLCKMELLHKAPSAIEKNQIRDKAKEILKWYFLALNLIHLDLSCFQDLGKEIILPRLVPYKDLYLATFLKLKDDAAALTIVQSEVQTLLLSLSGELTASKKPNSYLIPYETEGCNPNFVLLPSDTWAGARKQRYLEVMQAPQWLSSIFTPESTSPADPPHSVAVSSISSKKKKTTKTHAKTPVRDDPLKQFKQRAHPVALFFQYSQQAKIKGHSGLDVAYKKHVVRELLESGSYIKLLKHVWMESNLEMRREVLEAYILDHESHPLFMLELAHTHFLLVQQKLEKRGLSLDEVGQQIAAIKHQLTQTRTPLAIRALENEMIASTRWLNEITNHLLEMQKWLLLAKHSIELDAACFGDHSATQETLKQAIALANELFADEFQKLLDQLSAEKRDRIRKEVHELLREEPPRYSRSPIWINCSGEDVNEEDQEYAARFLLPNWREIRAKRHEEWLAIPLQLVGMERPQKS